MATAHRRRAHAAGRARLFAVIDELQQLLKLNPLEQIVLTNDFNASAAQYPRFGIFGRSRNILILGMPILDCMQPDHVKSVLAHEFGHFSRQHGTFPGWVERQRIAWRRLYAHHMESGRKARLLTRFLGWYGPRLDIASYALMRDREFEADQVSAEFVNSRAVADALITTAALGDYIPEITLDRWKCGLRAASLSSCDLTASMLTDVRDRFATRTKPAFAEESWQAKPDYTDSHPTLSKRIAALGYPLDSAAEAADYVLPPESSSQSATAFFLGENTDAVRARLHEWYVAENQEEFNQQLPHYKMSQVVLENLQKADPETLPWYTRLEIFVKRRSLHELWDGIDADLQSLLDSSEHRDEALFQAAMYYMDQEKWDNAIATLRRMGSNFDADLHSTIYYAGCHALKMLGRENEIAEYEKQVGELNPQDQYNFHLNPIKNPRLKAAVIEPWRQQLMQDWLQTVPEVREAWLADIDMQPEAGPFRYLLVKRKRAWVEASDVKNDQKLITKLQPIASALGINYILVDNSRYCKKEAQHIKKLEGGKFA